MAEGTTKREGGHLPSRLHPNHRRYSSQEAFKRCVKLLVVIGSQEVCVAVKPAQVSTALYDFDGQAGELSFKVCVCE